MKGGEEFHRAAFVRADLVEGRGFLHGFAGELLPEGVNGCENVVVVMRRQFPSFFLHPGAEDPGGFNEPEFFE